MIESFRHKGLEELFETGGSARVRHDLKARCLRRLDALSAATKPRDMNIPGFGFHGLKGTPKRYSVHVKGPWCITFEWKDGHPINVNLEQYH